MFPLGKARGKRRRIKWTVAFWMNREEFFTILCGVNLGNRRSGILKNLGSWRDLKMVSLMMGCSRWGRKSISFCFHQAQKGAIFNNEIFRLCFGGKLNSSRDEKHKFEKAVIFAIAGASPRCSITHRYLTNACQTNHAIMPCLPLMFQLKHPTCFQPCPRARNGTLPKSRCLNE